MKFSKSELDIIYQYAAPTKEETLAGMKEIVPVIKDLLTKAIVENAIRKLEKIPFFLFLRQNSAINKRGFNNSLRDSRKIFAEDGSVTRSNGATEMCIRDRDRRS